MGVHYDRRPDVNVIIDAGYDRNRQPGRCTRRIAEQLYSAMWIDLVQLISDESVRSPRDRSGYSHRGGHRRNRELQSARHPRQLPLPVPSSRHHPGDDSSLSRWICFVAKSFDHDPLGGEPPIRPIYRTGQCANKNPAMIIPKAMTFTRDFRAAIERTRGAVRSGSSLTPI
jgi:hypothetical protein